ncbi:ABC transporter permease [bacterium]|nr:ABC transporter permease [bacterium]
MSSFRRTLWAFCKKDFKDSLRTHSLLFVLLGPVILAVIFVRILDTGDLPFLAVGIRGNVNSGLVQSLRSVGNFQLEFGDNWESLKERVQRGELIAVINVEDNFEDELRAGEYPQLDLFISESSLSKALLVREGVRNALRSMAGQEIPADIRVEKIHTFSGSTSLAFLPMWIIFTFLGAMSISSMMLTEEIENKTLESLLLAPVSFGEILLGKIICSFSLSFISAVLLVFICYNGKCNYWILGTFFVIGSLIFSILGLIIASISKGQTTCSALNSLLYLVLVMPVTMADYNPLMQSISRFLPSWYLCEGLNRVMFTSASLSDVWLNISVLIFYLIVSIIVSVIVLKRWQLRIYAN